MSKEWLVKSEVGLDEVPASRGRRIVFGAKRRLDEGNAESVIALPFPSERTNLWVPKDVEKQLSLPTNGDANLAIVITQEVLLTVNQHVSQTLEKELGGFLLGNRYHCPVSGQEYIIIDQSSEAQYTESNEVSLAFTPAAWAQIAEEIQGKFRGKLLVGWYHSHPRMDVFLSNYDMALHQERFADAWMPALVIEPEKGRGGFFAWADGHLNGRVPVNFYEYLGLDTVDDRASVVEWSNYVCVDQGSDRVFSPPRATKLQERFFASQLLAGVDGQAGRLVNHRWMPSKVFAYALLFALLAISAVVAKLVIDDYQQEPIAMIEPFAVKEQPPVTIPDFNFDVKTKIPVVKPLKPRNNPKSKEKNDRPTAPATTGTAATNAGDSNPNAQQTGTNGTQGNQNTTNPTGQPVVNANKPNPQTNNQQQTTGEKRKNNSQNRQKAARKKPPVNRPAQRRIQTAND